ncbi:MAG: YggT family protein [Peptococcaceae bacterium]|nr:YggT family protein [Peptococcaceae bacterium]
MQQIFSLVHTILYWLLLFRIIVSFMPVSPYSAPVQFIYSLTEPLLAPIRNAFGLITVGGMSLDIAPLVLLLMLDIIRRLLFYIL